MKFIANPIWIALAVLLTACTTLDDDKIDYKSSGKGVSLEVPPDLVQLRRNDRFAIPGQEASANAIAQSNQDKSISSKETASLSVGDVQMQRNGNQRYLVVKRPADQLWRTVGDFWQDNGFTLISNDAKLGIIETDWAENRAKLPQDVIRNTIGRVFDSLYSTGERDRFRTRLEATPDGHTEIYITHRGMVEQVVNTGSTVWEPRASDPELEAEFLRRLMIRLGVSQQDAQNIAKQASNANTSANTRSLTPATAGSQAPSILAADGLSITLPQDFGTAWRNTGQALDRAAFTVEDRNRSNGVFFVRYSSNLTPGQEPGFFSRMFSGKTADSGTRQYRVVIQTAANSSTIVVQNAQGQRDTSDAAKRILSILADQLKP